MENKLKPCPFCGGKPEIHGYHGFWADNKHHYCVHCTNDLCCIHPSTGVYESIGEAIKAWDRRAECERKNGGQV